MRTDEYFDLEIETMSREDLRPLQQAKLTRQLDYLIARSPFYRDKFAAVGVGREDFRCLDDLQRFPFTIKEELRESQQACPPLGRHMAADMIDVFVERLQRRHCLHPMVIMTTLANSSNPGNP